MDMNIIIVIIGVIIALLIVDILKTLCELGGLVTSGGLLRVLVMVILICPILIFQFMNVGVFYAFATTFDTNELLNVRGWYLLLSPFVVIPIILLTGTRLVEQKDG